MTTDEVRALSPKGGRSYGTTVGNGEDARKHLREDFNNPEAPTQTDFSMVRDNCHPLFQWIAQEWAEKQTQHDQQIQQLTTQHDQQIEQLTTQVDQLKFDVYAAKLQRARHRDENENRLIALFSASLLCSHALGLALGMYYGVSSWGWTWKILEPALFGTFLLPGVGGQTVQAMLIILEGDRPRFCRMPSNFHQWRDALSMVAGFAFGIGYGVHTWGWRWQFLVFALAHGLFIFPYCGWVIYALVHCTMQAVGRL